MRSAMVSMFAIFLLACQESELPPPPIGGGGPGVPPVGSQSSGSNGDASGSGSESGESSGGSGSGSGSGSGTSGTSGSLVSGQLRDGSAGLQPVACSVRLHLLESFDRASGQATESFYEHRVVVRALPQAYAIESIPGDLVGPGDSIYVSTICDVDGDAIDDNLGAYYPTIPVEPVLLPAAQIDMTLDVLF